MKNVIITPTYNEKENIKVLIPLIFDLIPDIYVVVADDNSPDGTAGVVLELQKKYSNLSLISQTEKKGLGKAYTNAFSKVLEDKNVDVVIMMDADLSLQPKYLPEMIRKSGTYKVVTGSRYVKGSRIVGWKLWRRILSLFGNFYCRVLLPIPICDYTCGFNVIRADILRKIDFSKMDMSGYAFIIELKYMLYNAGATFFEVPIVFVERTGGQSKIANHIISEGVFAPWKMLFRK